MMKAVLCLDKYNKSYNPLVRQTKATKNMKQLHTKETRLEPAD
jgi:hypothetical protein